jgi:hypothetical protein
MVKYSMKAPRRLGWSPLAYAESRNIGEDLEDVHIHSGRRYVAKR